MKFEYKVIDTKDTGIPVDRIQGKDVKFYKMIEAGLNKLGQDGWKLCSCIGTLMFFIRELD